LRQNAHYQSLNQPGIVCGLGIRVISAPKKVEAQFQDNRWVQIQPGIAIDLFGNLIVVPEAFPFHIATELHGSDAVLVYLVASYVDPDELRRSAPKDVVQETFRIDEKSTLPTSSEIELCRILLQSGEVTITPPVDVFFPGYNNIDLRYRVQAQSRPQALVRMAQVNNVDKECARSFFNLAYLLQSVESLHPSLRGGEEVGQVNLSENLQEYDLLYLTGKQSLTLNSTEFENIKTYLNLGGVLLVDAPLDGNALIESINALARQLESPLRPLEEQRRDHPLRTKPFLFAALPMVNQQPIQILTGSGIILVIGDIASIWGLDSSLSLPRITIRTGQELGINILQYAWKRRQFIGLQQEDISGQW